MRFHDRISAACSRELRFPLLDFNVIEYSLKLSNELKMKDGIPKYPLKNIINKHLPNHLFNKKKELIVHHKHSGYKIILEIGHILISISLSKKYNTL